MTLTNALLMLGGIGLLLYGMRMMSGGLETMAGNSLQRILRKATSNRFLAVLVGIVTTIAINSSTATTVMTVGFVNSGLLSLTQSIGIILGSNVGTTFSSQLIAFGMVNVSLISVAALFIFIGAVMHVFFKNRKVKNIGFVILGFGIMFFGVSFMSDAMRPLRADENFRAFLTGFRNPLLALLAGFVVTAVIQSSTATTAMIVAFLATTCACFGIDDYVCAHCLGEPAIPFRTTAFILLGVNIGTSLTTVIASIPANRESKRAALFHIMYDVLGSAVFGTLIFLFPAILTWFTDTWAAPPQQAAMFHTLYNVATMLLLLPFVKPIAAALNKLVPVVAPAGGVIYEPRLLYLEDRRKVAPTQAVVHAHMEICRAWRIANENLTLAMDALFERSDEKIKTVIEREKTVDFLHHTVTSALVRIINRNLSANEAKRVGEMFVVLSEIEQIGDRAENIAEHTLAFLDADAAFSDDALTELRAIADATTEMMRLSLAAYKKPKQADRQAIKKLEKTIDEQAAAYSKHHFARLKDKICLPQNGTFFVDILSDLENCADCAEKIVFL